MSKLYLHLILTAHWPLLVQHRLRQLSRASSNSFSHVKEPKKDERVHYQCLGCAAVPVVFANRLTTKWHENGIRKLNSWLRIAQNGAMQLGVMEQKAFVTNVSEVGSSALGKGTVTETICIRFIYSRYKWQEGSEQSLHRFIPWWWRGPACHLHEQMAATETE